MQLMSFAKSENKTVLLSSLNNITPPSGRIRKVASLDQGAYIFNGGLVIYAAVFGCS